MDDKYYIKRASSCNFREIRKLILEHYLRDEIVTNDYFDSCRGDMAREFYFKAGLAMVIRLLLEKDACFVAIHATEKEESVVGFTAILSKESQNLMSLFNQLLVKDESLEFESLLRFFNDVTEDEYSRKILQSKNRLQIGFLTVHKAHRRKHIGTRLLARCIEECKAMAADLIFAIFASTESKIVGHGAGMVTYHTIRPREKRLTNGFFKYEPVSSTLVISIMKVTDDIVNPN